MPFDIGEKPKLMIEIKESEVINAMLGVHVLADPSHHDELQDWASTLIEQLTTAEKEFLRYFQEWNWQGLQMFSLLPHMQIFSDLEHFSKSLLSLSTEEFLKIIFDGLSDEDIANSLANPSYLPTLMEQNPYEFGCPEEIAREVFFNSINFREKYVQFLHTLHPHTVKYAETKAKEQQVAVEKVKTMLSTDEPLEVCQLIMGKRFYRVADYQRYLFCPASLVTPHKFRVFTPECLVLVFTPGFEIKIELLEQVKRLTKVLDDESRLKILRALTKSRSYGKELAENLNLTTATVSHHLELIRQAGLLSEEKVGNIKYFRVTPETMKENLQLIEKFLLDLK